MPRQFTKQWFNECFLAVCDLIERAQLLGNTERLMEYSKEVHKVSKRQLTLFGDQKQGEMLVLDDVEVSVEKLIKLVRDEHELAGRNYAIHPTDLFLFLTVLREANERRSNND